MIDSMNATPTTLSSCPNGVVEPEHRTPVVDDKGDVLQVEGLDEGI